MPAPVRIFPPTSRGAACSSSIAQPRRLPALPGSSAGCGYRSTPPAPHFWVGPSPAPAPEPGGLTPVGAEKSALTGSERGFQGLRAAACSFSRILQPVTHRSGVCLSGNALTGQPRASIDASGGGAALRRPPAGAPFPASRQVSAAAGTRGPGPHPHLRGGGRRGDRRR